MRLDHVRGREVGGGGGWSGETPCVRYTKVEIIEAKARETERTGQPYREADRTHIDEKSWKPFGQ